ncbi:MAG: 2-amino-4-hydroxy-6-hydroxymethyldihydropteridine diphosphokinase [Bacteroidales bacterium]
MTPTVVAIALGSNLGDREEHLRYALQQVATFLQGLQVSSFLETEPVDVGPQPLFLNAAATGQTCLSAADVLARLLAIEGERGRQRPHPGAPRTLDLDLILHGDRVVTEPGLHVPHPRFRERRFVLEPLAAIAPLMRDPVTGRTIAELLAALKKAEG